MKRISLSGEVERVADHACDRGAEGIPPSRSFHSLLGYHAIPGGPFGWAIVAGPVYNRVGSGWAVGHRARAAIESAAYEGGEKLGGGDHRVSGTPNRTPAPRLPGIKDPRQGGPKAHDFSGGERRRNGDVGHSGKRGGDLWHLAFPTNSALCKSSG